jgi:hypothetical protein
MALIAYWVAHAAGSWPGTPTGAQVKAGQLSTGSAASYSGSESGVATSGTIQIDEATAITGLAAGTAYTTAWVVYDDVALTYSNVTTGDVTTGNAYTLTADGGTFAYTGGDATLTFNRTLAADSGTFSYTGGDAGLAFNRKLIADSGTFSYAGGDATLTYSGAGGPTFTLPADGGTFAYSGGDAGLTFNRTLAAESGAFSYTGGDATFTRARPIAADGGTFSYAGGDATFLRSYVLDAESGAFSLSGGDADLLYSGAPPVEPTARRGGAWKGTGWQKARQRIALQTWWDYLTEETPTESTKRIIAEVKAGRPIPQTKTPKGPPSISAEKLAEKIIPSRLWAAENLIVEHVELQRVVAKAIRIAQERDDEDILMLL